MNDTTTTDLESLRQLVIDSEREAQAKFGKTELLEENPYKNKRHRPKKINPKFCYDWVQLDTDLKINRIIEYVGRYSGENDLPRSTAKKIRKLLVSALMKGPLDIEYDPTVGSIINVPKLFFNPKDGYFLGTYLNEEGELPTKVSKIKTVADGTITTEDFKRSLNLTRK
jgi:hypothetical protein